MQNGSKKWKSDYIFFEKFEEKKKMKIEQILEQLHNDFYSDVRKKFADNAFTSNVTESKRGSLIRKEPRLD